VGGRAEWLYVPDLMTKVASLARGEVDWWEDPLPDMWPVVAANRDITLVERDPLGSMGTLRFNHLLPPFANAKMRQAVLAVADQVDFMTAYAGDPQNWKLRPSLFTCGTPMASNAGAAALTGKRNFDNAKKLIAEAGYQGEKIVVLDAVDTPNPHAYALVTADLLNKLGLSVEIAASDWGNLVIRRASKKPVAEGGWNIFGTGCAGADMLDQSGAAHKWGSSLVRLALRRQAGGIAGAMAQGERQLSAPGDCHGNRALSRPCLMSRPERGTPKQAIARTSRIFFQAR
jgi:peptide/nickel transport system substrate-binding protein